MDELGQWCLKDGEAKGQTEQSAQGIHDNLVSGNH